MATPTRVTFNEELHRYWLTTDERAGRQTKGVTSLAKMLDDHGRLDKWRGRKIVEGMVTDRELVKRAAQAVLDRTDLDDIVDDALAAANAFKAAELGRILHTVTELIDKGLPVEVDGADPEIVEAIKVAYPRALADAGLQVIPEYIERVVVHPDVPVCGTFDRVFRRKLDGALVVGDLKTGTRALEHPHQIAIQMAFYANAPWIAGELSDKGVSEAFSPMPRVDRKRGYVIAMPADDVHSIHVKPVDIEAGWQAITELVYPALAWRDRDDLILPDIAAASPTPLTDSIKGRLGVLKMVGLHAVEAVARAWPADVPKRPPWSEEHGAAIAAVLTRVEIAVGAPF